MWQDKQPPICQTKRVGALGANWGPSKSADKLGAFKHKWFWTSCPAMLWRLGTASLTLSGARTRTVAGANLQGPSHPQCTVVTEAHAHHVQALEGAVAVQAASQRGNPCTGRIHDEQNAP